MKLGGDTVGTNWNYVSPNIVLVYPGSSETVADFDGLLPTTKRMPDVKDVAVASIDRDAQVPGRPCGGRSGKSAPEDHFALTVVPLVRVASSTR